MLTFVYFLGYKGSDCTKPSGESLNYSPALLGLIITLFIIIALLGGSVFYMIRQVSAYRDDMAHYTVLKGGDDGDFGMISTDSVTEHINYLPQCNKI